METSPARCTHCEVRESALAQLSLDLEILRADPEVLDRLYPYPSDVTTPSPTSAFPEG
ncbi:hypothetical protein ACQ86D_26465 [Streptomyces galilaeus]